MTHELKFKLCVQFRLKNLKGRISMPKFLKKQSTSSLVSEKNVSLIEKFNKANHDDLDEEVTTQLNASRNSFFTLN